MMAILPIRDFKAKTMPCKPNHRGQRFDYIETLYYIIIPLDCKFII